jgi:hypothetical protein
MDIAKPLPETINGNKYVLVAIDHYSKWCEHNMSKNMMFLLLLSLSKMRLSVGMEYQNTF